MIKKTTALLAFCSIACGLTSFSPIESASFNNNTKPRPVLRTIIIDPGHGGFDPGAHGLISREKDIALGISLKLGKALQKEFPGLRIVYTRTTDIMPGNRSSVQEGIRYRAELANREHGDLFICIHCNADGHEPGRYAVKRLTGYKMTGRGKKKKKEPVYVTTWVKNTKKGTATYIWKADRNIPKGQAISHQQEGGRGENMGDNSNSAFDMTSPEAKMRAQLYEKKYFANSATFGTLVEREFAKSGRHSDGVMQRQVGIGVLQATGMPSVLIETGYVTNKEEEIYLNSRKGQNEMVRDIVNAFRQYKKRLETARPASER